MIHPLYFWLNVFGLALGTIAIRFSIIALSGKISIPGRAKEMFTYIPAAILPAFMAPAVVFHEGTANWAFGKERALILVCSIILCYFYRSTLATISFGLVALYLVTHI